MSQLPHAPALCRRTLLCFAFVALACHAGHLVAQCTTSWQPGDAVPGTDGPVQAMTMHDPDGPGPLPPVLLLGGQYSVGGDAVANGLAAYDPATGSWSQFAGSVLGPFGIRALLSLPNGDLIAGGGFHTIGGVLAPNIARFDGTTWTGLATFGTSSPVNALARLPNGDILVGGDFYSVAGMLASRVARWDGTQWHAMGAGLPAAVETFTVRANGNVLAGGRFAGGVAEWNGASWIVLTPSLVVLQQGVRTILELPGGDLIVGGDLALSGIPAGHIARWNGSTWSALGNGLNRAVFDLALHPSGDIYAAGVFEFSVSTLTFKVARFDGTAWQSVGFGYHQNSAIATALTMMPSGNIFVGGMFDEAGGVQARNVASYDGNSWSPLASGTLAIINSVARNGSGFVAGGQFAAIAGVPANNVAQFDGNTWSPLGTGTDGYVRTSVTRPNGNIVIGGNFTMAGNTSAQNIAQWNGTMWQALPGANFASVYALEALPNGNLLVGVSIQPTMQTVLEWDGTTWTPYLSYGTDALSGLLNSMVALPDGDVIAVGQLHSSSTFVNADVVHWNGTYWSHIGQVAGTPLNAVYDVALLPNGDVVVAGQFASILGTPARNIARFDGTQWHALGAGIIGLGGQPGFVDSLSVLANGDLIASGSFAFAGGSSAQNIARWDGTSWHTVASGVNGEITTSTVLRDGTLVVGGTFSAAGGQVAAHLARWQPSCLAIATSLGVACPSTSGPMDLQMTMLPYSGGTFSASCDGMASNAIGAVILGLTSLNTPLSSLHPTGVANCNMFASADATLLLFPTNGSAAYSLPVANNTAFAGLQLNTQILQLELSALGHPLALSGSNGLRVTIGAY